MKKIIIGLGFLALGVFIGVLVWRKDKITLISPRGIWDRTQTIKNKKDVIGFLPTWMVGKTKLYGKELSQMVFLGIEVREDGSLVWDIQSKKVDGEEYAKLKDSVARTGGKNILGIKLFEDKKIEQLIASDEAKKRLMDEVDVVVKMGKFDGVNIDFEYMSNPVRVLDEDFLSFLTELRQVEWGEISIDVFANTVIKGDSVGLKKLLERVDKLIVMAYDFHRPGSDYAGPVAPIGAEIGERSIGEITAKIIESGLDKDKIVMAYPLYGYEWETDSDSFGSATRSAGYGKTVFYEDIVSDPPWKTAIMSNTASASSSIVPQWDETSSGPWAAWQEKAQRSRIVTKKVGTRYRKVTEYYTVNQWHQAYFEDNLSLGIKVEATKQAGISGIGFWALGYEGKTDNIVGELKNQFNDQ
jgi:spore germination protein YaaH